MQEFFQDEFGFENEKRNENRFHLEMKFVFVIGIEN
jgi:hypothetical protein